MEFSPTSSQYPAQSRVAARTGFCDKWDAYRPSSASLEGLLAMLVVYSPVARMTTLNGGAISLT